MVPSAVPQTHTPTFLTGQASNGFVPLQLSHLVSIFFLYSFNTVLTHSMALNLLLNAY